MDGGELRLQLLLGSRSQIADPDAEHLARVSAKSGNRDGRGHRLSGLAYPAWTAVSRAEAVVRDPALRSGRLAAPRSRACEAGARVRGMGSQGRSLRVGGTRSPELSVLPAQRR